MGKANRDGIFIWCWLDCDGWYRDSHREREREIPWHGFTSMRCTLLAAGILWLKIDRRYTNNTHTESFLPIDSREKVLSSSSLLFWWVLQVALMNYEMVYCYFMTRPFVTFLYMNKCEFVNMWVFNMELSALKLKSPLLKCLWNQDKWCDS